jgi:ubiquinone/menaquinone biosynthesis C-methylase UbiE
MHSAPGSLEDLKQRMRATWMAGDFGKIAEYSAHGAQEFVDRLQIQPGIRVLDVACGTGNLAIPAARAGADVTGVDIALNLVEQARRRAAAEGVKAVFDEGDAEQLPYPDAHFDLVMSMFGAMFAPRPERVASELVRVCRPGATIAMANWTPDGFSGEMFRLGSRYVPPPEGIPAPTLWGDETTVRERLAGKVSKIETVKRRLALEYPFPPSEVVQFFLRHFGPVLVAFSKLDEARQAAYIADMEKLFRERNEAAGGDTLVHAEYLEVVARV